VSHHGYLAHGEGGLDPPDSTLGAEKSSVLPFPIL
jgi:hypothetical protein